MGRIALRFAKVQLKLSLKYPHRSTTLGGTAEAEIKLSLILNLDLDLF
jgi:hypothetical protein